MSEYYAVIDIETTQLNRYKGDINYIGVGIASSLSQETLKTYIYNVRNTSDVKRFRSMCDKLKERKVKLVWQNGKFDTLWIELKYNIKLPIHHDIMLLGTAYRMSDGHALDDMAKNYLGIASWDIPLREKIKPNNPVVEKYLESDLQVPWKLFQFFMDRLTPKNWLTYNKLLRPAYLMYRKAERNGIYLDRNKYEAVKKLYAAKASEHLAVLNKHYRINWNSPAQVSDVLFNKEKLPSIRLTDSGSPSSDAKTLKRLAARGYKFPKLLQDYKFYYGANSKFLNQWGEYASFDSRIHPSFGLTNVRTGRTSCSDPNLQQVPRNKELRTLFTAPKGRVLIEADYSQIELRVACTYAKEPSMIRVYKNGGDIHTETGCSLNHCKPEDLASEMRSRAKPVNFGFLYGMSARGFIDYAFDGYGVVFTLAEATRYRELFFSKYSRLIEWHKEMAIECEMLGGVYNMFGQFRALPDIYSHDNYLKSAAIRRAINTPTQGTASGLLLVAATQIDSDLGKSEDVKIVGTVHDSILLDVPENSAQHVAAEIKRIMSRPRVLDDFEISFAVPIEADIGIGPWGAK